MIAIEEARPLECMISYNKQTKHGGWHLRCNDIMEEPHPEK